VLTELNVFIKSRKLRILDDINEEEKREGERQLSDAEFADESMDIGSVIMTLQYLKGDYPKNGKIYITLVRILKEPETS
jgi:hypothetical protein